MWEVWRSGGIAPRILKTSAIDGGEWSASRHGRFIPGARTADTHWIGGWVDPRAGLDAVMKRKNPIIVPVGNWNSVVQPMAQFLYWLSYPDGFT
jgi:hypothetical protein